jgi:sensor c-di-GMP phosphodiesterase-like protein
LLKGVDTSKQLAVQTEYGYQCFLYGKPMSADEFIILIRDADKPESLFGS